MIIIALFLIPTIFCLKPALENILYICVTETLDRYMQHLENVNRDHLELRLENPHTDYNRKVSYLRTQCHRLQLLMNPGKYFVRVAPQSSAILSPPSPISFSLLLWEDNSSQGKKEKWMTEEQETGKRDVYQNKHGCCVCVCVCVCVYVCTFMKTNMDISIDCGTFSNKIVCLWKKPAWAPAR